MDIDRAVGEAKRFAELVRSRRAAASVSRADLAVRLGCSVESVAHLEESGLVPDAVLLLQVAAATAVDGEDLTFATEMS